MRDKSVVRRIRDITKEHPLKIEIYSDEIVFSIWEVEIPIVYDILTENVAFKPSYMTDIVSESDGYYMTDSMLYDMVKVIDIIKDSYDEVASWTK